MDFSNILRQSNDTKGRNARAEVFPTVDLVWNGRPLKGGSESRPRGAFKHLGEGTGGDCRGNPAIAGCTGKRAVRSLDSASRRDGAPDRLQAVQRLPWPIPASLLSEGFTGSGDCHLEDENHPPRPRLRRQPGEAIPTRPRAILSCAPPFRWVQVRRGGGCEIRLPLGLYFFTS